MGLRSTTLIDQAARLAYQAHIDQQRKTDGSPYFIHPCTVASLLASYGFDQTVIAAGLVHDVLEDTTVTQSELEVALGPDVTQTVLTVTENKSLSWEERKKEYIENVQQGSDGAKAVSVADKMHNIESLLRAYQMDGPVVWKKLSRGRDEQCWFQEAMLKALRETWAHPILDAYADLVERLLALK